ncbi:MAG TPA: SMC-Scp complex subunit ScpB [Capsulimonadaceae bacterium]|jgi:segregation and condensation protein B
MKDLIEACLFISTEPVTAAELAKIYGAEVVDIEMICNTIVEDYDERGGGVKLIRVAGGYQMVTRPEFADDIAKFLAGPSGKARLSKPALETIAIVAYRQPITMAEIEAIRGVNADGVMRTLMDRKLVRETGRKQVPGRPILYGTTADFLHYFGLDSLEDLPLLDDIHVAEPEREHVMHEVEAAVGLTEQPAEPATVAERDDTDD